RFGRLDRVAAIASVTVALLASSADTGLEILFVSLLLAFVVRSVVRGIDACRPVHPPPV
ncbi:MAG: hypothetical protein HKN91_12180, partial [Acidimicrobiia bacterium]|nr:hypothetical protein [Acidimicrobiia bacterium]